MNLKQNIYEFQNIFKNVCNIWRKFKGSLYPIKAHLYAASTLDDDQQSAIIRWTLVTTTAIVPKDVAIKMNSLLYRIPNEQIDI